MSACPLLEVISGSTPPGILIIRNKWMATKETAYLMLHVKFPFQGGLSDAHIAIFFSTKHRHVFSHVLSSIAFSCSYAYHNSGFCIFILSFIYIVNHAGNVAEA